MAYLHQFLAQSMVEEEFHNRDLLRTFWGEKWGLSNSVGRIKRVLVHSPGVEVLELRKSTYDERAGALILRDEHGRIRSYCRGKVPPDLDVMRAQHDDMVKKLGHDGIEVVQLVDEPTSCTNRLFTRDIGMVVQGGVILSRFALHMRYGETKLALRTFAKLGMPILGMIRGDGFIEGGSFMVFDARVAFIGRSVRVNQSGIEQLRQILSWQNIELIALDIPARLIHLDEAFIMLDVDKALADPSALPYWFLEYMESRGMQIINVDPDDPPFTNNCLTLCPGRVLFPATGVRTIEKLTKAGIDVIPVDVSEINKMGGGIHCATLELIRDDIE